MKLLIDISGWLGSLLVVGAYALSHVKTKNYSTWCILMNLFGGVFIAVNCYYYRAIPSLVTNMIWSGIALFSIYQAKKGSLTEYKNRRKRHRFRY
ncbi:MAG: hypothetical protein COA80_11710 [Leeuwenhoekiella sp.]|uniref:CBU-0592-like domain-containing protein n=1 Tax=Leeuwenhoekiella nanhaiensis TaxID=1655491 RepID=A0A2G1VS94_9FLAO|nr:hypothetical protein [Leeuwenhoekiella nanhaiensis]PHQ29621.1 hypothetical protein CJ305_09930 [Leeuwenhoekiella nanhaiensis]PHR94934.1 MAG: hypothetical protein COA80_11710 [Leeuwenhoekiella sp.]